jgi:hypothetical protein
VAVASAHFDCTVTLMPYAGHILAIPVGQGGLVGTKDQTSIQPDKLIIARNLSYEGRTLRKEGGAAKYNSTVISGAPTVLGGWDWWPTDGVQRMIVALSDGTLKKDSGSGAFGVTLVSGLTMTDVVPVFVEGGKEAAAGNRKLFTFTGKNAVQVLSADGATTTALATPPADWAAANQPSFGFSHEGRLWGGGNLNDPHRLYASLTTNHEDFTTTPLSLSIYPGEGERLVGAISFKGLIVAWKFPVGIYIVDTTDPTVANWKIKRLTGTVGGVSPLGACVTDNDIVFVDATANFHLLSAVQEFGDAGNSNISKALDVYSFIQDNFNLARLRFIRSVYYAAKRELHFAVAGAGATVNTVRFVLDFNRSDMMRFRYSDRDTCESLWLRKDSTTLVPRLTSGDNAGFVWNMDQAVKSKGGVAYSGAFQTPHLDFAWVDPRFATVRKIGQFLEIVVEPTGNWNLIVSVFWDGTLVQTVTFNMGVSGAVLGTFVLGTDKLAGSQILNRKKRIVGSGRRLSLAASNAGIGEDFSVGQFILHGLIGDEREGRDAT